MPFDNGPITCRVCQMPQPLPENAVFEFNRRKARDLQRVGTEPEFGWVTGRHLLENRIDEETAYAGGFLHLALRLTERKVPASLLRAYCRMRELEWEAEHGKRPNRKQRQEIKVEILQALLPEMPPQMKGVPFVVDANAERLYLGAGPGSGEDTFLELFRETTGFEPVPLGPEIYASIALGIEPVDVPELRFTPETNTDAETDGSIMGRDFLTWLWYIQEEIGEVSLDPYGRFTLMLDGPLVFQAEDGGARESIVRKGAPTISAEAKAALMVGKKLRRAKLYLRDESGATWSAIVDADTFVFRTLKLPEGEALEPHAVFEERITNLFLFQRAFYALFELFLKEIRVPEKYETLQRSIKEWVARRESR